MGLKRFVVTLKHGGSTLYDRFPVPTRVSSPRFIGRAAELATLDAALARAAEGQSAAVLVAGDAGMGKSRLVAEFERRARDRDATVLVGECVELAEGELPYGPIVAALRPLVAAAGAGPVRSLHPAVRGAAARLWPELADPGSAILEGEFARGQLFEAVHRMLATAAEDRPVVLIIEDLHWSDRSTRDLLAFLIRNARREQLLFVASYRTDEVNRRHPLHSFVSELDRSGRAERVTLPPFTERELREQLAEILDAPPEPQMARRLFERCEGNPFFAEELLAAADAGMLPDSLLDALLTRVERLSEPTRGTLQFAAAVGRPVSHQLLASASGLGERELADALREAAAERVMVPTDDGAAYAFRHELLREAIYADLFPGERAARHAAIAEALAKDRGLAESGQAAAELAHHWHAAGRPEPALAASLDAADQAETVHAYAEAQRHLERALVLTDTVSDTSRASTLRIDLTRRAAQAASFAGEHRRGIALARRALAAHDERTDATAAALAHTRLARYLWIDGQGDEALVNYETAVALVPATPTKERAEVLGANAHVLLLLGRLREACALAEEALAIARATGARHVEANALNSLGAASGSLDEARARLHEARAIAEEIGAVEEVGRSWVNESHWLEQAGDLPEAVSVAEAGVARAAELGAARQWGDYLATDVASRLFHLGEWERAVERSREILELTSTALHAASAHTALGQVAAERGEFEQAIEHVARSQEFSRGAGGAMWAGPNCGILLSVALWRGEPEAARRMLPEALAEMADSEMVMYVAPLLTHGLRAEADLAGRARARGRAADVDDALARGVRLLDTLRSYAASLETNRELAQADAEFGRLGDRHDPEPWLSAADQWVQASRPHRAAYAQWRAAEVIVRAGGSSDAAAELLSSAAATAETLRARPLQDEIAALARRARLELAGQVVTLPGTPASDDLGLTSRERDVLLLLAEGRTNRQIGEQLFISEKTASVHVSRILAKLGVANRAEAAGVAHTLRLSG